MADKPKKQANKPKKKQVGLWHGWYYPDPTKKIKELNYSGILGTSLFGVPMASDTLGSKLFETRPDMPTMALGEYLGGQSRGIIPPSYKVQENVYPVDAIRSVTGRSSYGGIPNDEYMLFAAPPRYHKKIQDELLRRKQLQEEAARAEMIAYQRQHPISSVPALPFEIRRTDPYAGLEPSDGAVAGYGLPPWLQLK